MIIFACANKINTNQNPKTMKFELEKDTIVVIYNNSNSDGKKAIRKELGDKFSEVLPITTRIKTFEDAISELGVGHEAVQAYEDINWKLGAATKDILAYLKLRIITAALNEGWEPQFTENEYRYYPYFNLYTQKEVDEMTEERKKELGLVLWGGVANNGSSAGLACAYSPDAFSISSSSCGARLAFKSEELAIYAGQQFIEIYADFCFKAAVEKKE